MHAVFPSGGIELVDSHVIEGRMDHREALEYWASVGSWKACVSDRENELGERTAEAQCTAIKDLLASTERWREHF